MDQRPIRLNFPGAFGAELSARLDLPAGKIEAYALFAHCFTCSKDLTASRKLSEALTRDGIAVMRFDFTGLGNSGGDFASTNFTSNMDDLLAAVDYMRAHLKAPSLLVGHSLGGAAVIGVADKIPEVKAIATIGAPAEASHVIENFGEKLDEIDALGEAEVSLSNRPFKIRKQFIDDLANQNVEAKAAKLGRALLILHAPHDSTVGVENAERLYSAAKHPKSYISLDNADHLLSNKADASYAAGVIAAWAARYILPANTAEEREAAATDYIEVSETGLGKYQAHMRVGPHALLADEPTSMGGLASGPAPFELLAMGLGACTTMTLRMYADRKKLPLENVTVRVHHDKLSGDPAKPDRFTREVFLKGDLDEKVRQRMIEIADKCPVHKTLEAGAHVATTEVETFGD